MTKFLLSVHVLAALLAIGPVAVAASMFPRTLRHAYGEAPEASDAFGTLRLLHRICRVYAGIGVAVPIFGFATASSLGVLGDAWLITSIVLTGAAAAILALAILPAQNGVLVAAENGAPTAAENGGSAIDARAAGRLAMLTGVFNLLWATVTVLMIVRPGSTTGA
ncbi:hypothetical protein [Streptomyces sp. NPDC003077]|uniref:hypothetical protein n=1 Tax=Streptomyces sp. NPDC003077 TaxID=3154443 RepID=UPI0033A69DF2